MADTMTSKNIDLFSWDILHIKGMDWMEFINRIHLAQDRDKRRALVK
jgi:hypothetical protein